MQQFPQLVRQLIKQTMGQPPNLLYRRLEDALQQGRKVWLETNNDSFSGIPIHLDREFVELLSLAGPDEDESDDSSYKSTTWLLRLARIEAIAYPTEHWPAERFDNLLAEDGTISEPEE